MTIKKTINIAAITIIAAGLTFYALQTPQSALASATCATPCGDNEPKKAAEHKEHKDNLDTMFADDHKGHDDHAGEDDLNSMFEDDHDDHGEQGDHAGIMCGGHNVLEAECALCQGSLIGNLAPGQGMKVRLASPEVAAKAGVRTIQPQQLSLASGSNLPGRAVYDRNQLARMTALAPGVVRKVYVLPGSRVAKGDALIDIDMPEIAALKAGLAEANAQLVQLEASYKREQDLLERGISSRQEFQQAQAQYQSAKSASERYRQQLFNYGLKEKDLSSPGNSATTLKAPFAGVVTELQSAIGEAVDSGSALVTVANLDQLWIELAIPERQAQMAQVGASIQARFDGVPGTIFNGTLFQVGAALDERTRSLMALARVENPQQRLKVGMFGRVRVLSSAATAQLVVPSEALQKIDGQFYLFIQEEADLFEVRRVTIGEKLDGQVAIVVGLDRHDKVVSSQGFALKSEVLKARLGASCADH